MARKAPSLKLVKPQQRTRIERVISDYLADGQASGWASKTRRYYEGVLVKQLVPWCRDVGISDPADLDQKAVNEFVAMLRKRKAQPSPDAEQPDRGLSEATVHSYGRAVNVFLNWARDAGEVEHKARIRLRALPKVERDVLEVEDIRKLEDAAQTERDKLLIRLLIDTGLRASELTGLRAGDLIEEGHDRFLRVKGKGGDERKVPIRPALYQRLRRYRDRTRPDRDRDEMWLGARRDPRSKQHEPMTPSGLGQMLESVAEAAGIDKPTNPHTFRHSFITRRLRQKMDPGQVASIVGHKSLAMIYSHYNQLTASDAARALMAALREEE